MLRNVEVDRDCEETLRNVTSATWANSTAPWQVNATSELRGSILQPGAPQDLDLMSWPPDTWLPDEGMKGYAYDPMFGLDTYIYIYIIDNGINAEHSVRLPR